MEELFNEEFIDNHNIKDSFTIYQLAANLFQAKSAKEIIVLWKEKGVWHGATNLSDSNIIHLIGTAIDNYSIQKRLQKNQ